MRIAWPARRQSPSLGDVVESDETFDFLFAGRPRHGHLELLLKGSFQFAAIQPTTLATSSAFGLGSDGGGMSPARSRSKIDA